MSTIAYTAAVVLIGTSAAVASQFVVSADAPLKKRVELSGSASPAAPAYDFDKFAADVVSPVSVETFSGVSSVMVQRLKPVRVAALGHSQLHVIVRDTALAQKASKLAAAVDAQTSGLSSVEDEGFLVTGEEISVPSLSNPALVPLPKARPSDFSSRSELSLAPATVRKNKASKRARRKLRRPVRVAEANTTRQSRLARRLRSKGWLIGAFR